MANTKNTQQSEFETISTLKGLLTEEISSIEKDMATIEEKYKKLIEQEKEELEVRLSACKSRAVLFDQLLATFPESKTEVKESAPAPAVAEEPKITDTIFPENNEEPVVEENVIEETTDNQVDNSDNEDLSWPVEDSEEELTETTEEVSTEEEDDDADWGAFTEEWK